MALHSITFPEGTNNTQILVKQISEKIPDSLVGQPITTLSGFYTREEFISRYAEKSGREVSTINTYIKFVYIKLAVFCQQIYYRYAKGQTQDDRFAQMDKMVAVLIKQVSRAID
ncbi:hypothetical protein ACIQ2D_09145 [Lysinibacillus sp. NPDC097287]|uniref:hypothetical protein n=1 Tax=Lysinibacillus sp. NPDC097287 TaxID=3364144 RepID=UPI00380B4575